MFFPEAIVKHEFPVVVEDFGIEALFVVQEEKCPTDVEAGIAEVPGLLGIDVAFILA